MRMTEYLREHPTKSLSVRLGIENRLNLFLLKWVGRGKKILDLGCCVGETSLLFKAQNNHVYGIELNAEAREKAVKKGVAVKAFDLNDGIPFEDELFDVVYAGEVIESVYDTKALLEECHRVLKADGILIFSVPNLNSMGNRLRVLLGQYPLGVGVFPEDHHGDKIRFFNLQKLKELCNQSGFQIKKTKGFSTKRQTLSKHSAVLSALLPQFGEMLLVCAHKRLETKN